MLKIEHKMLEFIRSASDDELLFIAGLDYKQHVEIHFLELKKLIDEQNCMRAENQYWYPYEVIELGHYFVEPGHEKEFVICNLLVIHNLGYGLDDWRDMEDMRDIRINEVRKLPKYYRWLLEEAIEQGLEWEWSKRS